MVRTQIQFTDAQIKELRRLAFVTGRSIAELTREAVKLYLEQHGSATREETVERAISVAGRFASGLRDVATHHDRHVAEIFGE